MTNPKTMTGLLRRAAAVAGCGAFCVGAVAAQALQAHGVQVPSVPPAIEVPEGNQAFLVASAIGTQNYICMPSGWMFAGPQATLFFGGPRMRHQVATHFLSPNPDENGAARATWQSSSDSSAVWAMMTASSSDFAEPNAIPWLLLQKVGVEDGPTGGSALAHTTYIQRVNTTGGAMPTTACVTGARVFVPYTADYVFYRKGHGEKNQ